MQKNNTDLQHIGNFFGILLLFAYEMLTTILVYLPPLFGIFFTYMVIEYARKQQRTYIEFGFGWYLSIAFLLFAEQVHGFYIFSTIITFFIFFYFIVDWLFSTMKYRNLILIIFVTSGYIGTYLVNNAINYIQNNDFLYLDIEYIIYIVIESFVAIILFRERIV
ncbi:hypothetical protein [Campylobacter pinnipediorum]|uniref:Uncharacterized protein n=2 Tax=Campylobacter TaxID=194 RepID=A0AAX0LB35_9BACT|nr:hypothetical protein [Campylobacter pinnipediorum]AQW81665.1 putative membrane protein [Campylobacter pinnipediorum subsp. pinnipediorum]AQW83294.1 putative membrane protein [Campylobacter pinnipediorum subsp. pinnipediorum]AQW84862.1 putative membrane protein [Campylobacter pinnipediorum subsp. pinnipediorum]OPA79720.1 hypothetical protein BFG05_01030 [Campylobacter pinnipediorum subsp. pinnipediorum]OPA81676.1 hypothetical protein BFG04_00610 [Campylobacter pinnipediorum subsp. pinnipedio